jgi:hypothetical protein
MRATKDLKSLGEKSHCLLCKVLCRNNTVFTPNHPGFYRLPANAAVVYAICGPCRELPDAPERAEAEIHEQLLLVHATKGQKPN